MSRTPAEIENRSILLATWSCMTAALPHPPIDRVRAYRLLKAAAHEARAYNQTRAEAVR